MRHLTPYQTAGAFAALFDRTHRIVFRYIRAVGGAALSAQDVEDMTGETYLRAWKTRGRFQGDAEAALGWLLQIARRLVIDSHRKRTRHPVAAVDDLDTVLPVADDSPEDAVLSAEQHRALWGLIVALPEHQRDMIALRYVVGWQVKQIAAHLNVPENTISVTLRRIINRLAQSLETENEVHHAH